MTAESIGQRARLLDNEIRVRRQKKQAAAAGAEFAWRGACLGACCSCMERSLQWLSTRGRRHMEAAADT